MHTLANLRGIFRLSANDQTEVSTTTFKTAAVAACSCAQLALKTVLRRKGRVLDAMADSVQILRNQLANKPELKRLFDEWSSVLQQQSALVYGEKITPQQYRNRFEQLEAQRQKLEEAISTQSAEFRNAIQPVELAAIQAKIPKNAAMVEIVQCGPLNVLIN